MQALKGWVNFMVGVEAVAVWVVWVVAVSGALPSDFPPIYLDVDQFKLGRLQTRSPALPPTAQAPRAGISKGAVVLLAFNTGTG